MVVVECTTFDAHLLSTNAKFCWYVYEYLYTLCVYASVLTLIPYMYTLGSDVESAVLILFPTN